MQFKLGKGFKAGLIIIAIIFSASGLAYLSLVGTEIITNQFNETNLFYGNHIFKDTRDQCEFIASRLADPNLKNSTVIKKYKSNQETLKCAQLEATHGSAPTLSPDQLGHFLHNASSGVQTMTGTNNYILYLLHLVGSQATTTTNTTTSTDTSTTSSES